MGVEQPGHWLLLVSCLVGMVGAAPGGHLANVAPLGDRKWTY